MEEPSGNPAVEVMIDVAAVEKVDMKCKGGTVREKESLNNYDQQIEIQIIIFIQFCFQLYVWISLLYSILVCLGFSL